MSTPEWMQKFKQIGQKGEEEVTTLGEEGFVKTIEPAKVDRGATPGADPKVEEEEEGGGGGVKPPAQEDDAAALFHGAAGSSSAGELSEATPLGSEGSDDPATLFHAAGGGEGGDGGLDGADNAPSSPDPPTTNEQDGAAPAMTFASPGDDGEEKAEEVAATVPAAAATDDEDLGGSWVVDKNKFLNEEMKQEFGEEEVTERNLGEEHFEDVYVDDEGNEVFVDEDGNEVQEEEVLVDEDGNEIEVEEEYVNDEAEVPLTAVAERAAAPVAPEPEEIVEYVYVYDIEDQKKVLQTTERGKRSRMSPLVPILTFLVLSSAILLVVFLVALDDNETSGLTPSMAPTPMQFLPLSPTSNGNIEAAATTPFDAFQNNCDFGSLPQPNFIDQCACTGVVDIVADDVRARRENLMETFMPSVYPNWNETFSSCTAENQALLWLSSGINNGGEISNLLRLQRYALALLYIAQRGTEWKQNIGWLTERDVCEWYNVECESNSYVQSLDLNGNRLTGQLSEAAALLNAIEGFSVAQNELLGTIPSLYFESSSLRSINFSNNSLTGSIPPPSGSNILTNINLESNSLSGPLPLGIVNATSLLSFNVASNSFSGTIPPGLFELPLTDLAIGDNSFSGTFPDELSTTTTLTSLSLGPNLFTGVIPTSLGELSNLERLSIIGVPGLSGRLPASYGISLTNLVELTISETSVSGNIPDQFAGMTDLVILRLSTNSLGRLVTPALGQLTKLEKLHLNENAFSGTIPSQLGSLTAATELLFHTNRFEGTIPSEFGNLVNLQTVTFDGNFMDGRAPQGLCNLRVDGELSEFVVDCPMLVGDSTTVGIICSIPDCCTECL